MSCISRNLGGWMVGLLVGVVLVAWCGLVEAADREELMKRFDVLKANSMQAIESENVKTVEVTMGAEKIRLVGQAQIAPAPAMPVAPPLPPGPPLRLGVKVWGQLLDGRFVNLTKHKWQRSEQFYLWLETAVPIQLAFFQNYPDGRPPSRQVSPDERFPGLQIAANLIELLIRKRPPPEKDNYKIRVLNCFKPRKMKRVRFTFTLNDRTAHTMIFAKHLRKFGDRLMRLVIVRILTNKKNQMRRRIISFLSSNGLNPNTTKYSQQTH